MIYVVEKVWILIRWYKKPADLDLHCFQKRVLDFKEVVPTVALIRFDMVFWPQHKKTCLRGFRPSHTQTSLLSYRDWLENRNFACSKFPKSELQRH